jgi:hypothetical protein
MRVRTHGLDIGGDGGRAARGLSSRDLRSQQLLDLRRHLAPRLVTGRSRGGALRLAEQLPITPVPIAPVPVHSVPVTTVAVPIAARAPVGTLASRRRLAEAGRRAAAPTPEPLAIERGGVGATASATTAVAASPGVALATLGEQVLRHGRLLEILIVVDDRRTTGRGDSDLRIPDGSEGRCGTSRRRCRRLHLVFVTRCLTRRGDAILRVGIGIEAFLATSAATTTPATPPSATTRTILRPAVVRGRRAHGLTAIELGNRFFEIGVLGLRCCGCA